MTPTTVAFDLVIGDPGEGGPPAPRDVFHLDMAVEFTFAMPVPSCTTLRSCLSPGALLFIA